MMRKSTLVFVFVIVIAVLSTATPYRTYYESYRSVPVLPPYEEIIDLQNFEADEYPALPEAFFLEGKQPILLPKSGATWTIEIPQSGLYTLFIEYLYYTEGQEGLQLLIDGNLPFDEAKQICPSRFYQNELEDRDQPIRSSSLAPTPAIVWQSRFVGDTSGRSDYPFKIYLTKGVHKITLKPNGDKWFINQLKIASYQNPPSLLEYRKLYPTELLPNKDTVISLDGASYRYQYGEVDAMVYMDLEADPVRDYNALGRWRYPGNGVIWEFDVEEEGYYRVAFRYALGDIPLLENPLGRLGYKGFVHSERMLLLDGKLPYKEAEVLVFQPTDGGQRRDSNYWYLYSPIVGKQKNETFYLELYLTKGRHNLELIPTVKNRLPIIRSLEDLLTDVKEIEGNFNRILGQNPNPNLFYRLDTRTIASIKGLLSEGLLLKKQVNSFSRGSQVERGLDDILNRLTNLAMLKQISTAHLVEIRNIGDSIQRMLINVELMPLNIDSIELFSPTNDKIKVNYRDDSFWGKLKNFLRYRVNI